jgi:hypothetical protein
VKKKKRSFASRAISYLMKVEKLSKAHAIAKGLGMAGLGKGKKAKRKTKRIKHKKG